MCLQPHDIHWSAVKCILRYVKGKLDHGVVFQPSKVMLLGFFFMLIGQNCLEDRKSTLGYCVYFEDNLVSQTSKKQSVVSRSTTEVEYKSLVNVVSEVTRFRSLLDEVGAKLPSPSVVQCDNFSTVSLVVNLVLHARVKHMELDLHFVRDKVLSGTLQVNYVPGKD